MSYLDWHVGMKVVCIDDSAGVYGGGNLRRGEVYTISRIEADIFPEVAVQVGELKFRRYEFARASRFRPVQKRSTDISTLKALLNPTPEQIKALQQHEREQDAEVLAEVIRP